MDWKVLTLLVCCFGFFRDLRPSDAYLTKYLTSEWKNLTLDQVNNEIYPWLTYSYAIWLIPLFAFTDHFRYRSLLILDVSAYITTWVFLLWVQGIPAMKMMQVAFGLATAGEIGYFSYIYSMVDKKHFQKVASFTRCSSLAGRFASYLIGQFMVSYGILDLLQLNAFSFSSVSLAFAIAIFLPKTRHKQSDDLEIVVEDIKEKSFDESNNIGSDPTEDKSIGLETERKESNCLGNVNEAYCFDNHVNSLQTITNQTETDNVKCDVTVLEDSIGDRKLNKNGTTVDKDIEISFSSMTDNKSARGADDKSVSSLKRHARSKDNISDAEKTSNAYICVCSPVVRFLQATKRQIKESYSNKTVLIWSAWWIVASCGNVQVGNYIQNLWEVISPHKQSSNIYNGAVEAGGKLLGFICVALVGIIPLNWSKVGRSEALMTSVCALKAVILIVMATTTEIWVSYVLYGLFRVLYQVAVTIETAEIAKALTGSHYGFVFGCNMFLALVIESIFTVVVVDDVGLGVDVRTQFLAYGGYSGIMFVIFFFVMMVTLYQKQRVTEEKEDLD